MEHERGIRSVVVNIVRENSLLKDIGSDQDFFDCGASSLTIVDLQLQIEKTLNLEVSTSDLMMSPSIDGWVQVYSTMTEVDRVAS